MKDKVEPFTLEELNFIAKEVIRFEKKDDGFVVFLPYSEAEPEVRIIADSLASGLHKAMDFVKAMGGYDDNYIDKDFWDDRTY